MSHYMLSRYASAAVAILSCAVAAVAPAQAQMQQTAPPAAGAPPAQPPTSGPMEQIRMGMLEGAVQSVDPGAGTVQVTAGPFGVFRKTLEVNRDTLIQVEGRQGTLADVREGERIKASYETHETKNVATRIEVISTPSDDKGGASR
jgi:hypothetical protein